MPRRFLLPACFLVLAVAFAACGGGGDSGSGGSTASGGTISGVAFKGLFSAGTVEARDITSGGTAGSLVGSASVQPDGSFSVDVGSFGGAVLLTLTGGSFRDEVAGNTTQTAPLTAVVTAATGNPTANVTPLTSMAARIALERIGLGGAQAASITQANTQIANWFGLGDILTATPADLSLGAVTAGTDAANYGAICAAIAQEADGLSVASDVLADALARDLNDEIFDGQDGGNIVVGSGSLSTTAAQADLASALLTFLASGANQSGLTSGDFSALTTRLQSNTSNTLFVMNVTVTPGNLTVAQNMQVQYHANGDFSDGTSGDITTTATWGSTNPAATISTTGLATAASGAGSTDISATQDAAGDTSILTVGNFTLSSISVTPATPQVALNANQQFTATANYSNMTSDDVTALVSWDSASPAKLSIDAAGLATALTTGSSVISATETGTAVSGNTTATAFISYASNVQPIFNANCTTCHPSNGGLNLATYAKLMAGGSSGAVVVAGNSAGSLLVQRIEGTAPPQMPYGKPPLSAQDIQLIKDWIDAGALNN